MATIKFTVKGTANPSPIYIRLKDGRNVDVMAKTNLHIDPRQWNNDKQRPKSLTDEGYKKIANELVQLTARLLSHYNQRTPSALINTQWLKDFINPSNEHSIPTKITEYADFFIDSKKLTENGKKRVITVKNKLLRFEAARKKPLHIKDIDKKFQIEFNNYCEQQEYASNTTARDIRFIKTICRHAKEHGIDVSLQLDSLDGSYTKVDNIYLTPEEIKEISKLELDGVLDNVRDWLLISCFTGQRISDFLRFRKSMIRQQKNRNNKVVRLIEFTQKKTGKIMTIPLHQEVDEILKKRGGEFPDTMYEQDYNEHLKTVCEKAKITEHVYGGKRKKVEGKDIIRKVYGYYPKCELVASHIGRRSFATNFYGKIPTSLLKDITGHSTEKMFLTYIGKSASDRAIEAAEWF